MIDLTPEDGAIIIARWARLGAALAQRHNADSTDAATGIAELLALMQSCERDYQEGA